MFLDVLLTLISDLTSGIHCNHFPIDVYRLFQVGQCHHLSYTLWLRVCIERVRALLCAGEIESQSQLDHNLMASSASSLFYVTLRTAKLGQSLGVGVKTKPARKYIGNNNLSFQEDVLARIGAGPQTGAGRQNKQAGSRKLTDKK